MAENQFNESIRELLKGLDGFVTSKTVIGDPITVNETVIIPFMEVQMGVGAGAFTKKGQGTAGALGAKLAPTAILIIQNGNCRLIDVKNQDTVLRVLDMVPEVVDKLKGLRVKEDPEVTKKVEEILSPEEQAPSEA